MQDFKPYASPLDRDCWVANKPIRSVRHIKFLVTTSYENDMTSLAKSRRYRGVVSVSMEYGWFLGQALMPLQRIQRNSLA